MALRAFSAAQPEDMRVAERGLQTALLARAVLVQMQCSSQSHLFVADSVAIM